MAGDYTSFYTWTKIWAEGCRRAQGLDIPDPIQLPEAIWEDRERATIPSGRNAGRLEDHPEYTLLPFTPPGAPPKMLSRSHRGQVFYFSPDSLLALKAEASPANTTQSSDQSWVSTNDALSALLWRTVMAAQSPLENLAGDPVSIFNIAIDGRQRTNPKSSLNIADLAIRIRKSILAVGNQFADDMVTLVAQLEDVDRLVQIAFLDVPGFNCVQTSCFGLGCPVGRQN
ncbi:hypothetical protein FQN52_006316 [Onygenales sp. PD_12]|nr:hypothetical protein FQN52_006316 [Onygenales sp. PD_12]